MVVGSSDILRMKVFRFLKTGFHLLMHGRGNGAGHKVFDFQEKQGDQYVEKRIGEAVKFSVVISTGTLIATAFWYLITLISNGCDILSAQIPYVTLWEILAIGIVCGFGTELILHGCDMPLNRWVRRIFLHYVFVTTVVLVCGYFFGWYKLSISGVFLMCLTSAAVYVFTFSLRGINDGKTAKKMNDKLEERKRMKK